jgi:hypothetical protein
MVVAVSINLQRSFHTLLHVRSVVCSPPSVQPSSRRAARSTTITSSPKETAGLDAIVSPDRHASEMGKTRPRFRRRFRARHHPGTRTSLPLPCSTLARLASAPTCGTLPDCGISNTRPTRPGTGYHSGRRSPSQVSDALRPIGHVARRYHPPGRSSYVPGSRPSIVSADEAISPGRN